MLQIECSVATVGCYNNSSTKMHASGFFPCSKSQQIFSHLVSLFLSQNSEEVHSAVNFVKSLLTRLGTTSYSLVQMQPIINFTIEFEANVHLFPKIIMNFKGS